MTNIDLPAVDLGIPVPAMSASLAYFDSYRTAVLPQNLTQAQRDFFGPHRYERADRPRAGFVHADWPSVIHQSGTRGTSGPRQCERCPLLQNLTITHGAHRVSGCRAPRWYSYRVRHRVRGCRAA